MAILDIAKELHRRKSGKSDFLESFMEARLIDKLELGPSIDDLFVGIDATVVVIKDLNGRSMRVVVSAVNQWRFAALDEVDIDYYLFAVGKSTNDVKIVGWLPGEQVIQSPKTQNMERTSWYHEVKEQYLFKMTSFNFKTPCPTTPCNMNAVWDWDSNSWECFGSCERFRYDTKAIEWWKKYQSSSGDKLSS